MGVCRSELGIAFDVPCVRLGTAQYVREDMVLDNGANGVNDSIVDAGMGVVYGH
ncbi:hypothetical protein O5D80_005081 [Batrachochytrium dendrobatidis]|nr:hypothetical protein O5D80_005081 [Batrachochytrium dendrobatidis]